MRGGAAMSPVDAIRAARAAEPSARLLEFDVSVRATPPASALPAERAGRC